MAVAFSSKIKMPTPRLDCWIYCYFAGQAKLLRSQNRLRTEYLTPTDNIIVLDFMIYTLI